jgi:hypothetical protein
VDFKSLSCLFLAHYIAYSTGDEKNTKWPRTAGCSPFINIQTSLKQNLFVQQD